MKTPIVGEEVMLTIGSSSVHARVVQIVGKGGKRQGTIHVALTNPVCAALGEKVSLSRKVKSRFRFVSYFNISLLKQHKFTYTL